MKAVADLLCGSDEDCFSLFDRLSADAGARGRHRSYHDAFKWLLGLFPKERAAEVMPSLLKLLFSYGAEHWPSSRLQRTSIRFSNFVEDSKWLSMTAAAREIGVTEAKLRDSIDRGEVPFRKVSEKSNHNYIVPVQWVKEQEAIPRVWLDKAALRNRFSMTSAVLGLLREQGLFIPCVKAKTRWFLESDLQKFAERLLMHAVEQRSISGPEYITFDSLMRSRSSDAAKATFVASVLNGTIPPCGMIENAGLPGLLFDQKQGLRQLALGESAVTVEKAECLLKCHGAKGLAAAGYLSVLPISNGRTYVSTESVIGFDKSFASPRSLLEEADISIAVLLKVARLVGIDLMFVPNVHRKGKIWFVPRSRLQDLREAIPLYRNSYPPHRRQKKSGSLAN